MKRPFLTLALMLGALGAAVVSAHADTYVLTASLTGSEETPPPGLNTGAFGSATITLDTSARTVTCRAVSRQATSTQAEWERLARSSSISRRR
jgi:hypothetical protein